jgi:hypothetical protein
MTAVAAAVLLPTITCPCIPGTAEHGTEAKGIRQRTPRATNFDTLAIALESPLKRNKHDAKVGRLKSLSTITCNNRRGVRSEEWNATSAANLLIARHLFQQRPIRPYIAYHETNTARSAASSVIG